MVTISLVDSSGETLVLSDEMRARIALLFAVEKTVCEAPASLCSFCPVSGCSIRDARRKLLKYAKSFSSEETDEKPGTVVLAWHITKEDGEDATKELLGIFENGKQATNATASLPFWISFEEVEIGKLIW